MTDPRDLMSPYEQIGGERGVRALVDRFYDLMDSLPEASVVRGMHAKSLKSSREKLFWFLSGWLGGPQLYVERFGHPRLRMRHLPFSVDTAAAEQWMLCMRRALVETVADEALRAFLEARFEQLALHMRNQPDA
ncbi:MAG: group II truncated hemoglobin [Myxococcales bacterium]|nr:group II truncated hemoglobin [Myxococcales bacterium]